MDFGVGERIRVIGAREHNLANIDVDVPKRLLTVATGVSGSGKSSLVFDILHKEGQRQYLESLGMVTGFVSKPAVDSITGLSPSISVDQHLTNRSPRSTVGTATEVFTYLRVLWARIGYQACPECGQGVPPAYRVSGDEVWDDDVPGGEPEETPEAGPTVPCPHCGTPVAELVMGNFSFNKPAGACPTCTGLGTVFDADVQRLVDDERSVAGGAVVGWHPSLTARNISVLQAAARHYGFSFDADAPVRELGETQRDLLFYGVDSPEFRRHVPDIEPPATVTGGRFEGVVTNVLRRYADRIEDADYRERAEHVLVTQTCPDCRGTRLRPESRRVTVAGRTIIDALRLPLDELATWIDSLRGQITAEEWLVAEPIVVDLEERIRRLVDVGVGYLTLGQPTPSLSGGEAQRLRLAALLGSGLTGVLYVLDEPTIGLHPADTERLIGVLRRLRDLGNTVLVIEHDLDVLRAADHVVDIGPGAGRHGGRIVVTGTPDEVAASPDSVTGGHLAGQLATPVPETRRAGDGTALIIRGAREHNLKEVTVRLPLGLLVAVAGPSGSGKSSLMLDIVSRAARQRFYGAIETSGAHDGIDGWEHLDKVVTIDQQPISRVPRSNAATYSGAFTPIREAFAATAGARERGLTPGHFSFNVRGGRCERCEGAGVLDVQMHFLPAVQVRCPSCRGRRFQPAVLAVTYGGRDIAQVLDMTVAEALDIFGDVPAISSRLQVMADVGLGYLPLGQPATTLSGGEAQRIKLAKELARQGTRKGGAGARALYLLDEPTVGLHAADTACLLDVLQRLVDAGNTVVTIEHDTDVIRASDWVIELGPAGGVGGGQIVAEGAPEDIQLA
ncbi:excinuclease ABC subunit A [Actinobacteria bacterium YIM 96077]|uniref:UvrABC system protein A n=1 Tax=Phytoactinopolyspora halophila TaxID=1981511 RepID=A0A329QGG1_9ACTN|nr:excinuclease ABC subunit UvrA [Phytoactinopolyspora halophila]AYY13959.1 excinuclease ABC subunit A [Actinobacteria bacterium YIM 96077]RAW09398.1 excinuclease ABC subunit A [Phytoactinopolyspora halophila]